MSDYTIDDMMLDIQMRVPLSDIKQSIATRLKTAKGGVLNVMLNG